MIDWDRIIITADDDVVQEAAGRTALLVKGIPGEPGDPGRAATIEVGTVRTVAPDQPAAVRNRGTSSAAVFDMDIPQGEAGSGAAWGGITGDIADQADLQAALSGKADAAGITLRPDYIISDVDLEDGVSTLETGKLYFYYEA